MRGCHHVPLELALMFLLGCESVLTLKDPSQFGVVLLFPLHFPN